VYWGPFLWWWGVKVVVWAVRVMFFVLVRLVVWLVFVSDVMLALASTVLASIILLAQVPT
jgi:hypothetical protein